MQVSTEQQSNFHDTDVSDVVSLKKTIEQKKSRQKKLKRIFLGMGAIIFVLVLVVGYLQYRLSRVAYDEKYTSESVLNLPKNGQEVIKALGRHMILPDEQSPQIAEVQDVAQLRKTQDFFKNAENGDVVIMYSSVIYLYRPSQDRVVSAGSVLPNGETKP